MLLKSLERGFRQKVLIFEDSTKTCQITKISIAAAFKQYQFAAGKRGGLHY
jgi:hypothetical protein